MAGKAVPTTRTRLVAPAVAILAFSMAMTVRPWLDDGAGAATAAGTLYVANIPQASKTPSSIATFPLGANGDVAPATKVAGPNSELSLPYGVALTPDGHLWAANYNGLVEYAPGANGDVAPASFIVGAHTMLGTAQAVAVDASGNIFVGQDTPLQNDPNAYEQGEILEFAAGASGDAPPIAVIFGNNTQMPPNSVIYGIALDADGDIYASVTAGASSSSVLEFAAGTSGDVAPVRVIAGGDTTLPNPANGLALDPNGNIWVTDTYGDRLVEYAKDADGDVSPIDVVHGANTRLANPWAIAVDASGHIYVTDSATGDAAVLEFGATADGDVSPIAEIAGDNTGLDNPVALAILNQAPTQPAPSPTSTSITAAYATTQYGSPESFTATVSAGGVPPTGDVTFADGSTGLGTVSLVGGTASLSTSTLSVGTHSITATYRGTDSYLSSTSPPLSVTVLKAGTALVAAPATKKSKVFSATLTRQDNGSPIAGQTIVFSIAHGSAQHVACSAVTGPSGVASCKGTLQTVDLLVDRTYEAAYAGTANYIATSATGTLH